MLRPLRAESWRADRTASLPHRSNRAGPAVSAGTVKALDQDKEPEPSGDVAGDGYVRLTSTRRLVGLQMDAKEFFDRIVTPNYRDAVNNPRDLRLTYNAVITMNTAAEFLALHQLGYPEKLTAEALDKKANAIRDQHELLKQLKYHAEKMKHVRKLRRRDKTVSL